MRGHLVVDGRNLLERQAIERAGLRHLGVGWVSEP
jgi:hypothetical protein